MIYVHKSLSAAPKVFTSTEMDSAKRQIAAFYSTVPGKRKQQRYPDTFIGKIRNEFLPHLREEFHGKCAYCESPILLATTHSEYDHFRPKQYARNLDGQPSEEHYWWLAYEWQNIYYSCTKCNTYKSTWFPVEGPRAGREDEYFSIARVEEHLLVDPCSDDPDLHFIYKEDGFIVGNDHKGQVSIDIIKLNRAELVEERRRALESIEYTFDEFRRIQEITPLAFSTWDGFLTEWREIFSDNSPRPYLGIQRYFIRRLLKTYQLDDYFINRNFIFSSEEEFDDLPLRNQTDIPKIIDFDDTFDSETGQTVSANLQQSIHIFIEKLELQNFKCFDQLTIEFSTTDKATALTDDENSSAEAPWILFLGENGVGKSSILKAFTIGLAGREYLAELGLTGVDLLKDGEDTGFIKLHLVGGIAPVHVTFTRRALTSNIALPLINFVAYNAIRPKYTPPHIIAENSDHRGAKARSLFDFTSSFIDCEAWLQALPEDRFDRVALTLKDLMSLQNEDQIAMEDGRAIVEIGGQQLSVDKLSDGYQSIFYMAIDIMAAIELEGLPFELSEGMIIIDEIGAHLHPRWRMEVVGKLRKAFPKMRFVVSTHEPLCLRGIKMGEAVVLERDEDYNIRLLTDLPDPSRLRVDQLLTSDFFGLHSTMDAQTEKNFSEYYDLLAKKENELTTGERERLIELRQVIPKIRNLGDSERDNIIYDVVDKLLAEKKAHDPFRSVQEIKKETFDRLQKIWNIN